MLMPNRTNHSFRHLSSHKLTSSWRLPEYQLKPYLGQPNPSLFLPFFFSSFFIFYYLFKILDTGMSREPYRFCTFLDLLGFIWPASFFFLRLLWSASFWLSASLSPWLNWYIEDPDIKFRVQLKHTIGVHALRDPTLRRLALRWMWTSTREQAS